MKIVVQPSPAPASSPTGAAAPTRFPCQACGSLLVYRPGTSHLECPHCGGRQDIEVDADHEVVEHDFEAALAARGAVPAAQVYGTAQQYHCEGCGANATTDKKSDHCPFCDAPVVLQDAPDETFVPETVLPFAIDRRAAGEAFKSWVSGLWFAPSDLAKRARSDRIDGVYLPFWTYDAHTFTTYRGARGIHRTETTTDTDDEGNTTTSTHTVTDWYATSGAVTVNFDDVVVCASNSLPRTLVDSLEPWGLPDLVPFEPSYLSGFLTERKQVGLEEGFELAKKPMAKAIDSAIRRDIGGDEQRIDHRSSTYDDVAFKLFLGPVWVSSYRHGEKVFRFSVNGRTGEVAGERPYSVIKIAAAVLAGLALLGGIIYLSQAS